MKKLTARLIIIIWLLVISSWFIVTPHQAFAVPTPTPSPTATATPSPTVDPVSIGVPADVASKPWQDDPEVTFVGQMAARAGKFLDWTLEKYVWTNDSVPISAFWLKITGIVAVFAVLFVLIAAFVMIVTRGRSITIMRFAPRFIIVIVLMAFSFGIIQLLYQVTDRIQEFFLTVSTTATTKHIVQSSDLLSVGFDYKDFIGLRIPGLPYNESAFISLLLVKITAITYYVMTGLLLVRKIILWFFIIVSPVFPFLLLFSPVRNTAKIWIGEFFRWLLYAPLFAIFLNGLVALWQAGIPLNFNSFPGLNDPSAATYPLAVNIILGGPGQTISATNSVNTPETFALYVVALLMLWVVIILPFLLLNIFLDYFHTMSLQDNTFFKQMLARGSTFINKGPGPAPAGPQPPGLTQPGGAARALPFANKFAMPTYDYEDAGSMRPIPRANLRVSQQHVEVAQFAQLPVPTMRDIVQYETAALRPGSPRHTQVTQVQTTLANIANPQAVGTPVEQQHFTTIRQKLMQERQQGNPLAATILSAANISRTSSTATLEKQASFQSVLERIANPSTIINTIDKETYATLREKLVTQQQQGNQLATSILSTSSTVTKEKTTDTTKLREQIIQAKEKGDTTMSSLTNILQQNSSMSTNEVLRNVAEPSHVTDEVKRAEFTRVKESLTKASQEGNSLATTILQSATTTETKVVDTTKLQEQILAAKASGDPTMAQVATLVDKEQQKTMIDQTKAFPVVNRVQSVSLDDYESVKKMWQENYQNLDVPQSITGVNRDRKAWVKDDIVKITEAIDLLLMSDPQEVKKGMEMVGGILPFLLIGGFSQAEVISYLKAKLEAAKSTMTDLEKEQEKEDTLMDTKTGKIEEKKEMTQEVALNDPLKAQETAMNTPIGQVEEKK